MTRFLEIFAYWVVFGLPLLMVWRFFKLKKTKGRPKNYYVGTIIMYIGIAVWIPYALIRRIMGIEISVFPFLVAHLIGIFSGGFIKRSAGKASAENGSATAPDAHK